MTIPDNDQTPEKDNHDNVATRLVAVARGHGGMLDETDRKISSILDAREHLGQTLPMREHLGQTLPMVSEELTSLLSGTIRSSTTASQTLADAGIGNDCNTLVQSSSYDSHESFHSVSEHTYLFPEGERENADIDINGGKIEEALLDSQQALVNEADEDENLFREKQSFEEGRMVTLYSSARSGQIRNGYHRYDFRTQASEDDIRIGSFSGETCGIIDTENDELEKTAEVLQNTNGSATDEAARSEKKVSINFTLAEMGSSSVPCSPANELRQRHATNYPDYSNGTHDNIYLSSEYSPNRLRSYTSPDSRSSPHYQPHQTYQTVPSSSGDQYKTPQRLLLSSLDSGMSALRRWMVSHSLSGDGSYRQSRISRAAESAQAQTDELEESNIQAFGQSPPGDEHLFSSDLAQSSRSLFQSNSIDSCEYNTNGNTDPLQGAILYPQTIQEEDEHPARQRANSEPERSRLISFNRRRRGREGNLNFPPINHNWRYRRQQRASDAAGIVNLELVENALPSELTFAMDSSDRLDRVSFQVGELDHGIELLSPRSGHNSTASIVEYAEASVGSNREARMTWIRITRRFQLLVVLVGLIFSSLLFSIMVTWVVLMSAYVVSIDDGCDLPLKPYFWLATVQLMLDVFRKDIMKFVFRFDSSRQSQQIPSRVMCYNLAYLTYAMLVLRVGVFSVFLTKESQCPQTATKLFNTTKVFVSISIAAWLLVLFGYLIPFCIVAILLTRNGYSPEIELRQGSRQNIVVPLSNANNGAPPGCTDMLKVVTLEDLEQNENFPNECCVSR